MSVRSKQPGVHSDFQDSQDYTDFVFKKKKKRIVYIVQTDKENSLMPTSDFLTDIMDM